MSSANRCMALPPRLPFVAFLSSLSRRRQTTLATSIISSLVAPTTSPLPLRTSMRLCLSSVAHTGITHSVDYPDQTGAALVIPIRRSGHFIGRSLQLHSSTKPVGQIILLAQIGHTFSSQIPRCVSISLQERHPQTNVRAMDPLLTKRQMTATPNHALQRTGVAVTARASAAAFPPAMHGPRQPRPSLSLGSLCVASFLP